MKSNRKVLVVLVDRANYGRLKPVMFALKQHKNIELQIICTGSMVLERFQRPVDIVVQDGFKVDSQIYIELEGSIPATMAKSLGFGIIEFTNEFQRLKPDFLMIIGDRYEALAATLAAVYQNICVVHIQGGEVSGSIDESARHAMSKFAHYHFPATERAAKYLIRMGEAPDTVFTVGCPVGDIILNEKRNGEKIFINDRRLKNFDFSKPYNLVIFHPTTTCFGDEKQQMQHLLNALNEIKMPTILLWPNIDAGADHISNRIRTFINNHNTNWLKVIKNLPPEYFQDILGKASCAIGNSSSFVRDSSFWGTPVVLIGQRQEGREIAENVLPVSPEKHAILTAIHKQLSNGNYQSSGLYGDGASAHKIAKKMTEIKPYTQKKLHYIYDEDHTEGAHDGKNETVVSIVSEREKTYSQ